MSYRLQTLSFISKNIFYINGKVYYDYSLGSDNNYSASFLCVENEFNEIIHYRGMTHYCSFYKNNVQRKQVKEYILSQLSPVQIIEAEEIEGVEGEIEIKEK